MSSKHEQPTRKPSVVDVARQAGVSAMTVSRVIRKEPNVRPETARKVEEAIQALGYRSNPMVQTLMASVRRRLVNLDSNLAWIEEKRSAPKRIALAREGARLRAHELGFGFEEIFLDEEGLSAKRLDGVLRARGVRGAIIAPMRNPGTSLDFPWSSYALATIGSSLAGATLSHTMAHYQHSMERTLEEIKDRGYRRIAFLSNRDSDGRSEHVQIMAFLYHNHTIPRKNRIEPVCIDGWEQAVLHDWLTASRADAVISSYPVFLYTLRKLGFALPENLGFASLSWWEEYPEVSGIRPPLAALGAGAVDLVVGQIHRNERGIPNRPKTMLVEGDWVEGQTLRPRS